MFRLPSPHVLVRSPHTSHRVASGWSPYVSQRVKQFVPAPAFPPIWPFSSFPMSECSRRDCKTSFLPFLSGLDTRAVIQRSKEINSHSPVLQGLRLKLSLHICLHKTLPPRIFNLTFECLPCVKQHCQLLYQIEALHTPPDFLMDVKATCSMCTALHWECPI